MGGGRLRSSMSEVRTRMRPRTILFFVPSIPSFLIRFTGHSFAPPPLGSSPSLTGSALQHTLLMSLFTGLASFDFRSWWDLFGCLCYLLFWEHGGSTHPPPRFLLLLLSSFLVIRLVLSLHPKDSHTVFLSVYLALSLHAPISVH